MIFTSNGLLRWFQVALTVFWIAVTGASLWWNLAEHQRHVEQVVRESSRSMFNLIETARLWNARHGGVYARVDENTPPNPYLDVPDRDLTIGDMRLTMVNPAYMTRQIAELAQDKAGVMFHITSLKPIRPANKADPWESEALKSFESGEKERIAFVDDYMGQPVYRYMAPLVTVKACLKCHEKQGYKLGDIRGGISVTTPAARLMGLETDQDSILVASHVGAALILISVTLFFTSRLARRTAELEAVREQQDSVIAQRTAELHEKAKALEEMNAELETFAYGASHDLQEPVRMVSGYLGLLERRFGDALDDDGRDFMEYAKNGAERMHRMLDDLLEYSRVNRRGETPKPVDLTETVHKAIDLLSLTVEEKGATVEVGDLPTVCGDEHQLVRLFQNLIGNALKYARPDVAPEIDISADHAKDDKLARIRVSDNGMGLPAGKEEEIFHIFSRGDQGAGVASNGTGIGLAISRKIVERFGGDIWAASNANGGATFFFTVPLQGQGGLCKPPALKAKKADMSDSE